MCSREAGRRTPRTCSRRTRTRSAWRRASWARAPRSRSSCSRCSSSSSGCSSATCEEWTAHETGASQRLGSRERAAGARGRGGARACAAPVPHGGDPGDLDLRDLPGAADAALHSAREHHPYLPAGRHAVGVDPDVPDVPHPVLHVALDGLLQDDPEGARGVRANRRRDALRRDAADRFPDRRPRHPVGRHLRVHAVVERVHLRARLPLVAREEDGPRRRRLRAHPRRHLLLGSADGGRVARLDPRRPRLLVLRGVLRHGPHRIREGLNREGETTMAQVMMKNLNKKYDEVHAVKDVNLHIRDKEFMVLVGPSGCGKSTTLRMVAGLEEITAGEIMIGDRVVNDLPPKDRDIAMVFQNYALYPHMTVYDNMAFGLKMRKFPKLEIQKRVQEAAEILGIQELLRRKPRQLSRGQRQRVALGRAIVRHPQVFLFDEPLPNLDAKLRVQMRVELKRLHERLETTAIYVTHDQVEAMTLGSRVVVMKDGWVQQVGEPLEIYSQPLNRFVAGFIGSPSMNFIPVTLTDGSGPLFAEPGGLQCKARPPD